MYIRCVDLVSEMVEEANCQFSPAWQVNQESFNILKQYCSVIDSFIDEFHNVAYGVSIDEIYKTVSVTMECIDVVARSANHKFYELIKRSDEFSFSVSKEGNLNVKFVFPSLWEKAS